LGPISSPRRPFGGRIPIRYFIVPRRWLLAPAIHPTSSCSRRWSTVLSWCLCHCFIPAVRHPVNHPASCSWQRWLSWGVTGGHRCAVWALSRCYYSLKKRKKTLFSRKKRETNMKKNLTGAQTTSVVVWARCCSSCPFVLSCVSPVWQSPILSSPSCRPHPCWVGAGSPSSSCHHHRSF
jgi:hypothetical protein